MDPEYANRAARNLQANANAANSNVSTQLSDSASSTSGRSRPSTAASTSTASTSYSANLRTAASTSSAAGLLPEHRSHSFGGFGSASLADMAGSTSTAAADPFASSSTSLFHFPRTPESPASPRKGKERSYGDRFIPSRTEGVDLSTTFQLLSEASNPMANRNKRKADKLDVDASRGSFLGFKCLVEELKQR